MSEMLSRLPWMSEGRRKYTDAQLIDALKTCRTMREVLSALGLTPRGGNYETVRRRIAVLGLDASHLRVVRGGRRLSTCTDAEVAKAVASSRSLAQVLSGLGVRPGGNQGRLSSRVEQLRLDTSHFVGQAWRRGASTPTVPPRPLEELLVVGPLPRTNALKKRLIAEGLRQHKCEICLRDTWSGHPIPLELDHINGRRDDNRLVNLRILCPNCHAQTPTYRGRNIGAVAPYSDGT
jgi:5-methylcytosine-specific restriction endonuclease McrA